MLYLDYADDDYDDDDDVDDVYRFNQASLPSPDCEFLLLLFP